MIMVPEYCDSEATKREKIIGQSAKHKATKKHYFNELVSLVVEKKNTKTHAFVHF